MDITIEGPCFYNQEDENVFFSCIYNLPDFLRVKGHGTELTISFTSNPSEQTIIQLLIICRRWGVDPKSLLRFKTQFNPTCSLWDNEIYLKNI
jgi:hypothetical protein